MNRTVKGIFVLLTAVVMLLPGCTKTDTITQEDKAGTGSNTETSATENLFVADSLPELDYGGNEVKILVGDYMNAFWGDFYAEDETGSRLNDAVYKLRKDVDTRLNISLKFQQYPFVWASMNEFNNYVTSNILAGDSAFDIVANVNNFAVQQMENPYFYDLTQNKYIDFSKPWWNKTILDSMPNSSVHFATGDGSLAVIKHTMCIFFNQTMMKEYGINDDMYELVKSGTWTLDKLKEYAGKCYNDINGDGKEDFDDAYGLTFGDSNKYLGFINSLGMTIVEKDADGKYTVTFGNERAVNVVETLCELINDTTGVYPGLPNTDNVELISSGGGNYVNRIFTEGRSVLSCGLVQDAATIIPNIDFDYGIMPYPKYDENQSEYRSQLQRNLYFTIPVTCSDFDTSGAVLEAWSSLAYRQLQPEYFEIMLKVRYSSDEKMADVYDLLRTSVVFDIGEIFSLVLDTPSAQFRSSINNNDKNWSSYIAKNLSTWDSKLDNIYEAFNK